MDRIFLSPRDQKFRMSLTEVTKPYGEPNILAEYIALQLESRVA
jgi:ribosomal protein S3